MINHHRIIHLALDEVAERDVLDDPAPDTGPRPRLDARAVLGVAHVDVAGDFLNGTHFVSETFLSLLGDTHGGNVLDNVKHAGELAEGAVVERH